MAQVADQTSKDNTENNAEEGQIEEGKIETIVTIPRLNVSMIKDGSFNAAHMEISIVGKAVECIVKEQKNKLWKFSDADNDIFYVIDRNEQIDAHNFVGQHIEIRGYIHNYGNDTIKEDSPVIDLISHQIWGESFNLKTWNKFIKLTHKYPNLF